MVQERSNNLQDFIPPSLSLQLLHPPPPGRGVSAKVFSQPELQEAFLDKLKAIDGISTVETQTYTLEEAPSSPEP